MAGLLDGLEQFGLGNLEMKNLFDEADNSKQREQVQVTPKEAQEFREEEILFDKSCTCLVCDKDFKVKTVKNGKAKLLGTDLDLRPRHEGIDMLKYDVVVCPHCGFASLTRYFKFLASIQVKNIKETICKNFKGIKIGEEIYTYEEALERYKLALANSIVKQAKASEKAYICLKTGWLVRGMKESLDPETEDYQKKFEELEEQEQVYLHNALEGFVAARMKEGYPMCGMDETTLDYLLAVLAYKENQFDVCSKLISGILTSNNANSRMKDKTRDLKDMVLLKMREKNIDV